MVLKFKDIDNWKPTSISIVDKPSHPMAVFEVYEDDDEFIKKYKEEINLSEQNTEETVTMSSSFFEKVFGGLVSKSEPEPEDKKEDTDEVTIEDVMKRIDSFDERFSNIEDNVAGLKEELDKLKEESKEEEPEDKKSDEPLKDMVKKSKEVDPDLTQSSAPNKSLMSRIGRSEDGMKW